MSQHLLNRLESLDQRTMLLGVRTQAIMGQRAFTRLLKQSASDLKMLDAFLHELIALKEQEEVLDAKTQDQEGGGSAADQNQGGAG